MFILQVFSVSIVGFYACAYLLIFGGKPLRLRCWCKVVHGGGIHYVSGYYVTSLESTCTFFKKFVPFYGGLELLYEAIHTNLPGYLAPEGPHFKWWVWYRWGTTASLWDDTH